MVENELLLKIAPRGAARGNEAKEKGQNQQNPYEQGNNNKDNIIGIWDEAGGDKDGITSVSFIITGGDIVEEHSEKTVLILEEVYKMVHDFIPLRKDQTKVVI